MRFSSSGNFSDFAYQLIAFIGQHIHKGDTGTLETKCFHQSGADTRCATSNKHHLISEAGILIGWGLLMFHCHRFLVGVGGYVGASAAHQEIEIAAFIRLQYVV